MSHSEASLSVSKSLAGKHIVLTGTTGFLGKVVLEKIIRCLPDIYKVTLIVRQGAGFKSVEERVKHEVFNSSVFDALRESQGELLDVLLDSKIKTVAGDLSLPNLGMAADEYKSLCADAEVLINCAASVNFREPLDNAIKTNVASVEHLINFVKSCQGIPFVQVSTCYVNGFNQGEISEKTYGPQHEFLTRFNDQSYHVMPLIEGYLAECAQIRDQSDSEKAEKQCIDLGIREARKHGWNDSYTFTKWMAEQILIQQLKGSGLTIVRPSIIESTVREPVSGWLEGIKVADALIFAFAKGRLSFFPGNKEGILDVIPADLVANSILLAAAEQLAMPSNYRIYQACSGGDNPISLGEFVNLVMDESEKNYASYPKLFQQKPESRFKTVSNFTFQNAMRVLKLMAAIKGMAQPAKRKKIIEKIQTTQQLAGIYAFYTAANYQFESVKLKQLWRQFSETDRAMFPVSACSYDWKEYVGSIHMNGLHTYVLEERTAA
jgi:thioester reductase-like protein